MVEPTYVYIKNGDAVDQITRILDDNQPSSTSGPDAFIADFLKHGNHSRVIVLSRHERNACVTVGDITAEVSRDGQTKVAKFFLRIGITTALLGKLLCNRPNRLLCGSTGSRLWAAYIASVILRIPLVHSRHNRVAGEGDGVMHRLSARLDGLILRRIPAVVCHGPYLVDEITRVGVNPDKIFEFDVDFEDYEKSERAYNVGNADGLAEKIKTGRYFLFVGRLELDKGITDLLEAASQLLESDRSLRLVFAGDGGGRTALEQRIQGLGLQEQVCLLGRVPHTELVPLLMNARCLIAPTRPGFPEGRCMSVMEALVMGLPAVVPDFGPFPYLIQHDKNGLVFKAGSISDLGKQLQRLQCNENLVTNLAIGAEETGNTLRTPSRTFNQAVNLAFANT